MQGGHRAVQPGRLFRRARGPGGRLARRPSSGEEVLAGIDPGGRGSTPLWKRESGRSAVRAATRVSKSLSLSGGLWRDPLGGFAALDFGLAASFG